MDLTERE
jgi:hypothetical protein